VKVRDLPRTVALIANIVMPDHLPIRRVQERDAVLAPRHARLVQAASVPLRLRQNILRAKRELLRLNNTNDPATHDERVIRRPRRGRELLNSTTIKRQERPLRIWRDPPTGTSQLFINELFPRYPFRIRSSMSFDQIRSTAIFLPPLAELEEIVRRVGALLAIADRLEARYEKARVQVDKLTQSTLSKAFRGELVPTEAALAKAEGRDYETAEQLLARIRGDDTVSSRTAL
jgi:hypothetical protein